MTQNALLPGISSHITDTPRLHTHFLASGPDTRSELAVLVHGNVSGCRFFEETMRALPSSISSIAPDLRGYGDSETKTLDATRGLRDFSDDLHALLSHPSVKQPNQRVHLAGWSVGGGVVMQYAIDHPEEVASITLIAPMSPYGFGGTKDIAGTPCYPDFAGSGGATANPEFVKRLAAQDASEESDFSPRKVMNAFYFKPPFRASKEREEVFVAELLKTKVSPENYPGGTSTSPHWPTIAPAETGMNNAISPRFCNLSAFAKISPKPPVLWIRGDSDQIVSDTSLFDLGFLGQLGAVPGWPGADIFPPQPMIGQMRALLESYRAGGGTFREHVLPNVGHSPHIEAPEAFQSLFHAFIQGR